LKGGQCPHEEYVTVMCRRELASFFEGVNFTVLHPNESSCNDRNHTNNTVQILLAHGNPCKCTHSDTKYPFCSHDYNNLEGNYCTGWNVPGFRLTCPNSWCNFVLCNHCYAPNTLQIMENPA